MESLSKRDQQVLALLEEGLTDAEACRRLGLTEAQLEKSVANIAARAEEQLDPGTAAHHYHQALAARASNRIRSLQARLLALMDASPDSILVVDGRTGIVKEANERAVKMFGYPANELVGLSVEVLVPDQFRVVHSAYRVGFLSSMRKREMGYHPPILALKKDGTEVEIAIALTATTADDDVMVVCTERANWIMAARASTTAGSKSSE